MYKNRVDLRIIPIVFNRASSLKKCLQTLYYLDTVGDTVAVDIWIDRSTDGVIDEETYRVAVDFAANWTLGKACVHNQSRNAYITGQWIDTWMPPRDSKELAIIIEDDITISPLAYRWLKAVHQRYSSFQNISGYTLQMENVRFFAGSAGPMYGPQTDTYFLYPVLGTWGFAPHPQSWRNFQKWYHKVRKSESSLKPYVPGIEPTDWYKMFEEQGRQETMWEMWHIYYAYISNHWCVYPNLISYTGRPDVLLSTNRKEAGLHFENGESQDSSALLLMSWEEQFSKIPMQPAVYMYDGTNLNSNY